MSATAAAPSLTPVLVRLKLSLMRNGLRQSGGRTAAFVTSLVVVLLIAAFVVLGFLLLRGHEAAGAVAVLTVGVFALGWAVMPLFLPSGDETLDPSRLVMLPLRPEPLVRALLVASLVGIGPLFTLCLAVGAVASVAHGATATVLAVTAVPLVLLVCVALSRAIATANVRLLTSRKGRDMALLSGLVIALGIQAVNFGAQALGRAQDLSVLDTVASVVGWLPPASAVAAVVSAADGDPVVAVARLVPSVVALAVLLWWWRRSLVRLMVEPDGSTIGAAPGAVRDPAEGRGRVARLLPGGRTGAVMERCFRYIWRDPKTKASWVSALAVGALVPFFNAFQEAGSVYWACFASGMLGVQMFNQFGQDSSAFWMVAQTIATPEDAYAELRDRVYVMVAITVPFTVVVAVGTALVTGGWSQLPEVFGLAFALLGAMLALGVVASVRYPYAIPQESRRNVAPGQGGVAVAAIFGGMLGGPLLCAPLIGLLVWLRVSDHHALLWLLLPLGVTYGALLTWGALRLMAGRMLRRLPEILAAVGKG
ncbi:transporter [Streptomyces omiyaensis]|uniref:transporter n=1 Tax=Streptomyces omiyaensis TaxID=68247 RepID=UPI001983F880|nr:transporter [Streptomyces omiyaensis]